MDKKNTNIQDVYSLTPLQSGMLYHTITGDSKTQYVIQQVLCIGAPLINEALKKALMFLAEKYDILKTAFVYERLSVPRQIVLKKREIEFDYLDFSRDQNSMENEFLELCKDDQERGFALNKDSLLRVKAVKMDENKYKLIWTMHHIIADGWSISLLLNDFIRYYKLLSLEKVTFGLHDILSEKSRVLPFSQYVSWLENQDMVSALQFWKRRLLGYDEIAAMNPVQTDEASYQGVMRVDKEIQESLSEAINRLAQTNHITVNTVVECAVGILLQSINNLCDVVFGKVVSGRNVSLSGIDNAAGLFINTVPIRIKSNGDISVMDLLKDVFLSDINGQPYEFCSLSEIQNLTNQKSNLIKVLYCFENYYYDSSAMSEICSKLNIFLESYREETNYDITIQVSYNQANIKLSALYKPNVFSDREAELILERLEHLLANICNDPYQNINNMDILLKWELDTVLNPYNNTDMPRAYDTLDALFEKEVRIHPDNIAVKCGDRQISYRDLYYESLRVCSYIKRKQIMPRAYIGVLGERKIDTVINILGVLMAGCAYVPINPTDPSERREYILKFSQCEAFLSSEQHDQENNHIVEETERENNHKVDAVAYAIFTSGSTGVPKGVIITHKAVVNTILDINERFQINNEDCIICLSSFSFDLSVYDIFGALSTGAKLLIVEDQTDMECIRSLLEKETVTFWNSVPAIMQLFLENSSIKSNLLKNILLSGDWIPAELPAKIKRSFPNAQVTSLGGATEGSIWSIYYPISTLPKNIKSVPYGRPLSNQKMYILDQQLRQCPVGIKGEICIAGVGVAQGYLNDPEKTRKSFIQHPKFGKLYKTGDLGVMHMEGYMEILGRMDTQVKINGYRIELGEIENIIKSLSYINNAAVIAPQTIVNSKALYAYYTSDIAVEPETIKKALCKFLPQYMIPTAFIQLKNMPLTKNGKVDKQELSVTERKDEAERKIVLPQTETEASIYRVVREIVPNPISIYDSFFEIGIDSMKLIKLAGLLKKTYEELTVKDLMQHQTIKELASSLEKRENTPSQTGVPAMLATSQLEQIKKAIEKYNRQFQQCRIENNYVPLDKQLEYMDRENAMFYSFRLSNKYSLQEIKRVLNSVINEQPSLRSTFIIQNNKIVFVEKEKLDVWEIPYLDFSSYTKSTAQFDIKRFYGLDYPELFLEATPLVQPFLFLLPDCFIVVILANHSVWDLKSNEIFQSRVMYYLHSREPLTLNRLTDYIHEMPDSNITRVRNNLHTFICAEANYSAYLKQKNTPTCVIYRTLDTDTFLNKTDSDLLRFGLKLLKADYCFGGGEQEQIPVLCLYHNRTTSNADVCGPFFEPVPIVITSSNKKCENLDNKIYETLGLFHNGVMPCLNLRQREALFNNINAVPCLNVAIDLNDSLGSERIQDIVNSCEKALLLNKFAAHNVFIRICSDVTKVAIFTFETNKDTMNTLLDDCLC